jgi:hypothetical protein
VLDSLGAALLENTEIVAPKVGDGPTLAVHGGGGEHDEVAARGVRRDLGGGRRREGREQAKSV